LREALYHAEGVTPQGENYIILAANTVGSSQGGAMEAELCAPAADELDAFEIFDSAGNKVPFAVKAKTRKNIDVFSPVNLPGRVLSDCYSLYLDAGTLEPFSFKVFTAKKSAACLPLLKDKTDDVPVIENEYVRLSVSEDGRISITDLKTGRTAEDCIYFEDTADRGDSYVYFSAGDKPILSCCHKPQITVLEKNAFKGSIKLTWRLPLPAYYDFENLRRSQETEISSLSLTLSVIKGRPATEIIYEINNRSKDHRVRLMVKTDIVGGSCFADTPYDIIKRTDDQHFSGTMSKVFPNTSFALLQGGGKGFAVLTQGAHEFEQTDERTLAFTVPFAHRVIENLARRYGGQIVLGAGTVLDSETARIAILSGADFVVSPHLDLDIVRLCNRYRKAVMAGIATVTEAVKAMECGVDILKLFPAEVFGPAFIKSIMGPLPYARIMPTGGVDVFNVGEWMAAGAVAVGAGGCLLKGDIAANAESFIKAIEKARKTA